MPSPQCVLIRGIRQRGNQEILDENINNEIVDDTQAEKVVKISLHAMLGTSTLKTMRLFGILGNQ